MNVFSKSTLAGLLFGLLLAGYAVFAFTPPIQAPPAGNVTTPLNTGGTPQVKSGGLWVGSLAVGGGVKVGSFSSTTKPTCDAGTVGTFIFNTTENKPHICASGGWKPLDSDNDKDGLVDWFDPNDNSVNPECAADNGGLCFIRQTSKSALDTDLAASNIKIGVNIFGQVGALEARPVAKSCGAGTSSITPCIGGDSEGNPATYYVVSITALNSACASYCGSFTPTITCDRPNNNSYLCNGFNYNTCEASNFGSWPSGVSSCLVSDQVTPVPEGTKCSCS